MKNNKIFLLLFLRASVLNVRCSKDQAPEQKIIEQAKEKEPEQEEQEEEEPAEVIPNNPDLYLLGGQADFKITPNSGIMSGNTSVSLKIIYDDFMTIIPNENTEYQIVWKTNGIYGHFTNELIEATTIDTDSITNPSTNTDITNGEEKFAVTVYSRPKGSDGEFELIGSSGTTLTITNEANKKYFLLSGVRIYRQ